MHIHAQYVSLVSFWAPHAIGNSVVFNFVVLNQESWATREM
jgi:hypothetical protein